MTQANDHGAAGQSDFHNGLNCPLVFEANLFNNLCAA
jgi:hypothetical protein